MFLFPQILETRTTSALKAVMLSPAPHPIFFMLSVLVLKLLSGEKQYEQMLMLLLACRATFGGKSLDPKSPGKMSCSALFGY